MEELIKMYLDWYKFRVPNKPKIMHTLKGAKSFYIEQETMFRSIPFKFGIDRYDNRIEYLRVVNSLRDMFGIIEVSLPKGKTLYLTPEQIKKRNLNVYVTHDYNKTFISIPFELSFVTNQRNNPFPYVVCHKRLN